MFEVRSPSGRLIRRINSREHAERLQARGHIVVPTTPVGQTSSDEVAKPVPQRREHPQPIACEHRGDLLRSDECPSCAGRVVVKVFACDVHRECQLGDNLAGVKSCVGCAEQQADPVATATPLPIIQQTRDDSPVLRDPAPSTITAPLRDSHRSLNPKRPWEGASRRPAWEYRVTATLCVIDPGESLECVIDILRQQTERPYIIIVDTGSTWDNLESLHRRHEQAEDVEIHSLRSRGWRHSSACVGASLDIALATCHTEFLFATHDDVFLKRRDYISDLLRLHEQTKAVAIGYEMSPRDWLTDQWEGMVSHTATLFHVPTLHKIGASWSFESAHYQWGITRSTMGWPDTETAFGLLLKSLGLKPHLIGHETNYERFEDENLVHCRSYTGSKLYGASHHEKSSKWVADEIDSSRARLADWGSAT